MMKPSTSIEQLSDREIIDRILAGETSLYEAIVRRYNAYLYKTGRAYGYDHCDTEDLMQETYINAYVHLGKFENRSSFKTWIVKIMLNQCYHKKHKPAFQKEATMQHDAAEKPMPMFTHPYSTDKAVLNRELSHILESALQHIPESYRMVFTLRELNTLSVLETSEALHMSENNVKVKLSRAKNMLRNEIQKMYSPEDIFEFNLVYCDKMVERVMSLILAAGNAPV